LGRCHRSLAARSVAIHTFQTIRTLQALDFSQLDVQQYEESEDGT
jgi:hypothetical protein